MSILALTVGFIATLCIATNSVQFGHDFLKYYNMPSNYMNLNFGSYGLTPLPVLQNQTNWRTQMEACADCWFRYNVTPYMNNVQQLLARYLGINDWTDLVFTLNASHGVNAVLRSLGDELYKQCITQQTKKCKILYFSTAFPMVVNTLAYITNMFGDEIDTIQFSVTREMFSNSTLLLISLDEFLQRADAFNTIYLSSISHIASCPAILFDVKSIQSLMRNKYNITLLIDGAHAMGHIDINITDIDPDIYVSNGHKWLYSPKGSSILYVKRTLQPFIYPTVINGKGFGVTQFQRDFNYQGANDHTAWLSMSAAMEYRESVCGGDRHIKQYIHTLCVDVSDLLVHKIWNTSNLLSDASDYGAMVNIELPTSNATECELIQNQIYDNTDNDVYFSWIRVFVYDNKCYVRLSCQIFNEISDYQWLAERVLYLLSNI